MGVLLNEPQRAGVGLWSAVAEHFGNTLGDAPSLVQGVLVRHPDDGVAPTAQPSLALRIAGRDGRQRMNAAVDLDDEPRAMTDEIDDVWAEWRLSAKVAAIQI